MTLVRAQLRYRFLFHEQLELNKWRVKNRMIRRVKMMIGEGGGGVGDS